MLKNILLVIFIFISGVLFILWRSSTSPSSLTTKQNVMESDSTNKIVMDSKKNTQEEVTKEVNAGESLDLSNKGLNKLPSDVFSMTNLESLDVSGNNLEGSLPGEIRHLQKLKVLNAANNKMTGVPAEVGQLSKLEVLDLSNNQLTGLPYELGNLKNLKVLNLSGNDYSTQDLEKIKEGLSDNVQLIL